MEEPFIKVWSWGNALGLVTASLGSAGPGDRAAPGLGRRGTHKEKRSSTASQRGPVVRVGRGCKHPNLSGILLACANGQTCEPGHQLGSPEQGEMAGVDLGGGEVEMDRMS